MMQRGRCPSLMPALSAAGHTGRLLQALLVFSLLFLAAHLTFQIGLHTVPRLDQLLGPSCECPWVGMAFPSQPGARGDGGAAALGKVPRPAQAVPHTP